MEKSYEIALATDSNYIIPTTVLLKSLFVNNCECEFVVNVLYLTDRLLDKDVCFLKEYIKQHGHKSRFLSVSEDILGNVPDCRHTKSTYLRLFLPQLMPIEVDKVLYLDSDIVISGSIVNLLQLDLDSYSLAAVKESINIYDKSYQVALGIPVVNDYFNAGVIYLNLKKMREDNAVSNCLSYLNNNLNVIKANDQDVLNGVFWGSVKYISPIYNFNYWIEKDIALQLFSKEEYKEVKTSPRIIHYIGPIKPWLFLSMHPKKKIWWYYLKQTPFKKYKPIGKNTKNIMLYPVFMVISMIKRNVTMKMKQQMGFLLPLKLKIDLKRCIFKVQ
ncbi:glycosyltransferase family 8 protein [Parabacteroides sp. AF48-14]|uniref:glycosyltransferase family 8 protein n=1 Tax=Parabacteroides sp. AF48-14 TaxID=2292052 RepID=UPI000EFFB150|nr:glycosyltransferase family 8 protein [Parabacteroides sp. AF48-14]RHO70008.1 glycosyltransferase family 8 protein [Parabacteroides sp. AF48-14]